MPSNDSPQKTRRAPTWMCWLARCGIVAEGLIYVLIGGLALGGAFDPSQHPSGSKGAMDKLSHVPLGPLWLGLLALGLAAFVLWQVMQALFDPEYRKERWQLKRMAVRFHHLWSAVLHCGFVGLAVWQLLQTFGAADPDSGSSDHGQTQKHLTAIALSWPDGRWLVAAIAVGIIGFGIVQWVLACRPEHDTRMDLSRTRWRWPILALLVYGYAARGALFGLIGMLLMRAAWHQNSNQATGVAGALQSMRQQAYGPWLLGAVAIGVIAFGVAHVLKARYRDIRVMC